MSNLVTIAVQFLYDTGLLSLMWQYLPMGAPPKI